MIRIHHLTDIHFGRFSKAAAHIDSGLSRSIPAPRSVYEQYLRHLSALPKIDAPDFVIISGDLTSVGSFQELLEAQRFVEGIRDALGSIWDDETNARACERIVIVPGNHDYSYAAVDDSGRMLARGQFYSLFKEYITPHRKLAGNKYSGVTVHNLHTDRTGPIAFYCVDSCGIAGHVNETVIEKVKGLLQPDIRSDTASVLKEIARLDPGFVNPEELERGLADAPDIPPDALKICVVHHPVHSAATQDVDQFPMLINAGSLRAALSNQQVHVVLSGHVHSHDMLLQYPVDKESFGWGIFSLIGGTFGSHGDTEDCFTSLEFEPMLLPAASGETDGWLCRTTKFESGKGEIKSAGPLGTFFVEQHQQTMNRHLAIHKDRSSRAEDSKRHNAQKAHEKLTSFFNNFELPPTLNADRVEDLGDWVSKANRIYAVDVQAFDAWLDPLVFYYFCLQIPRYVAKALDADTNCWTLRLTPLVHEAIQSALKNIKRYSRTHFRNNSRPGDNTHVEVQDPGGETSIEIARVLLWSKETLCSEDGKSFCKMHDALRIPLFYLNPVEDELDREDSYRSLLKDDHPDLAEVTKEEWEQQTPGLLFDKDNLHVEYIYGLKGEAFSGGIYVDLSADQPEDQIFRPTGSKPVGGRFHNRIHFEQLLRHKKLRFAIDAIEEYDRKRGLDTGTIGLRPRA
jgi:Icc-related predicted phosphoesterase